VPVCDNKAAGKGGVALAERMGRMQWQERILVDPKILAGKPVIKDTRIAVDFVIDLLGRGWTVDQVLAEYDHVSAADVQACLAYAGEWRAKNSE
jgi:uncharacterized protein (DUF433 family)